MLSRNRTTRRPMNPLSIYLLNRYPASGVSHYRPTLYRYTISKKFTYTPNVKFVIRIFVQLYSIVSAFGIRATSHRLFRAAISFGRRSSVSISINYQVYKFKNPPKSSSPKCFNFLVNVCNLLVYTIVLRIRYVYYIIYIFCFIILLSKNILSNT